MKQKPSVEVVRRLLHYDPESGVLTWRTRTNSRNSAGAVAGCDDGKGYRMIGIDHQNIRAHVVIWAWMTGEWPASELDHVNMVKSDNRWENIRLATPKLNAENRRSANVNSVTGTLGVSPHRGRFMARIKIDGRHRYLGTHDTIEIAHQAYVAAKRQLHEGGTL